MTFLVGGILGSLSELLLVCYSTWLNLPRKESGVLVVLTLIFISSILTALGIFDVVVAKFKSALIIPITGFANSVVSPSIEFKTEGYVYGTAAKMFVIAGPIIVFGIASSVLVGIIYFIGDRIF